MTYKTRGLIIKRRNLGELDRLITVYTENYGKLLLRARSVRKSESKLKGHLELFLCSDLIIAQGKSLDIITGAETIESFPKLREDLSSLSAIHYISMITDKLIAGSEKDESIYCLLINSFRDIENKKEITLVADHFEKEIL